jgi:preprotein translocase SecE subunit
MAKVVESTLKFMSEVKAELTKVTWPNWPELKGSTILVIIVSAFFAMFIGGVDIILAVVRQVFLSK